MFEMFIKYFGIVNEKIHHVIFFDVLPGEAKMPFVIMVLIAGCLFFSAKTRLINFRLFKEIFNYTSKAQKDSKSEGGVDGISSVKALAAGIAGSVGIGSIAGVAMAVSVGGPGAVFWIFAAGVLSMPFRFAEVFLAHKYRSIDANGKITLFGPYGYMVNGLKEFGFAKTGRVLAAMFAFLFCLSAMGGANSFQSNQAVGIISSSFFGDTFISKLIVSSILSVLVGLVIIGGIKRIGSFAQFMVMFLGVTYLIAITIVLCANRANLGWALHEIMIQAFNFKAIAASLIPAIVVGVQRSLFADEVGLGSVPMMHSSSSNQDSFDEAIKSMAGPFFCSAVICTINGFAIVCSKAFLQQGLQGAELVRFAYQTVSPHFAYILPIIMFLFAYAVAVSWFYYGESSIAYLLQHKKGYKYYLFAYKLTYCLCLIFGGVTSLDFIIVFIDNVTLGTTIPNTIVLILLSSKVVWKRKDYMQSSIYHK